MKTNFLFRPAVRFPAKTRLAWASRLRIAVRPLFAGLCASLLFILTAPAARADGPAGRYKLESSSGSISFGDNSMSLPQKKFRDKIPILRTGRMVIEDDRVRLDRKTAKQIIRRIFHIISPNITVDTTISGPTDIQLHREGKIYFGSTIRPMVVTMDAAADDEVMHGHWHNQITAKVSGETLKLTISMSGRFLGKRLNGLIVATCRRETDG